LGAFQLGKRVYQCVSFTLVDTVLHSVACVCSWKTPIVDHALLLSDKFASSQRFLKSSFVVSNLQLDLT